MKSSAGHSPGTHTLLIIHLTALHTNVMMVLIEPPMPRDMKSFNMACCAASKRLPMLSTSAAQEVPSFWAASASALSMSASNFPPDAAPTTSVAVSTTSTTSSCTKRWTTR